MKNITRFALLIAAFVLPVLASAQTTFSTTGRIIQRIGELVGLLIPILVTIALLVFFWGLVKFISTTSSEGKAEGKNFMVWGLIALFVMVSVWGIVDLIARELNVSRNINTITVPSVPR